MKFSDAILLAHLAIATETVLLNALVAVSTAIFPHGVLNLSLAAWKNWATSLEKQIRHNPISNPMIHDVIHYGLGLQRFETSSFSLACRAFGQWAPCRCLPARYRVPCLGSSARCVRKTWSSGRIPLRRFSSCQTKLELTMDSNCLSNMVTRPHEPDILFVESY